MQQVVIHRILGLHVSIVGKIFILLIDAIGRMVHLRIILQKGEKGTQSNYGKGNFGAKGNKVCTYYGLSNHTIDATTRSMGIHLHGYQTLELTR